METDFKAMYLKMFGASEDANKRLTEIAILTQQASLELIAAQRKCEELYLQGGDNEANDAEQPDE